MVEEAKLNNRSTDILHIYIGFRETQYIGVIFALTYLVLMLPMFFTTLHTLTKQAYNLDIGMHGKGTKYFINPYYSCVLRDNLYPIHSI